MSPEETRKRYDSAIQLAGEAQSWLAMFFSKEDKTGNLAKAAAFLVAANNAMGEEQIALMMREANAIHDAYAQAATEEAPKELVSTSVNNVVTVNFKHDKR